MKTRCASCGWQDENTDRNVSQLLAHHLRVCPLRDDLRFVPRWALVDGVLEGAWTVESANDPNWETDANGHAHLRAPRTRWYPFTAEGQRRIGVRTITVTPMLEAECVNGDIVHDAYTRQPIRCLACKADLRAGGHLGTCKHSVMRTGPIPLARLWTAVDVHPGQGWTKGDWVYRVIGVATDPTVILEDTQTGERLHHVISSLQFAEFQPMHVDRQTP